jgi:hypothetical protein
LFTGEKIKSVNDTTEPVIKGTRLSDSDELDNEFTSFVIIGVKNSIFQILFKVINEQLVHYGFKGFKEIIKCSYQAMIEKDLEELFFTHLLVNQNISVLDSMKIKGYGYRFIFKLNETEYFSLLLDITEKDRHHAFKIDTEIDWSVEIKPAAVLKQKLSSWINQIMDNHKYISFIGEEELKECSYKINAFKELVKLVTSGHALKQGILNHTDIQKDVNTSVNKIKTLIEVVDDLEHITAYVRKSKCAVNSDPVYIEGYDFVKNTKNLSSFYQR